MPLLPLEAALKRLSGALDQLETATAQLDRLGRERRDLGDALTHVQDDRARIAHDLDAALDRARTLEEAADAVAARLRHAGAALRTLLAAPPEIV